MKFKKRFLWLALSAMIPIAAIPLIVSSCSSDESTTDPGNGGGSGGGDNGGNDQNTRKVDINNQTFTRISKIIKNLTPFGEGDPATINSVYSQRKEAWTWIFNNTIPSEDITATYSVVGETHQETKIAIKNATITTSYTNGNELQGYEVRIEESSIIFKSAINTDTNLTVLKKTINKTILAKLSTQIKEFITADSPSTQEGVISLLKTKVFELMNTINGAETPMHIWNINFIPGDSPESQKIVIEFKKTNFSAGDSSAILPNVVETTTITVVSNFWTASLA